jgi:hypothetical protein
MFGDLPELDIQKNIDEYGGVNIKGDHIFFVNAVEDPWKYASIKELKPFQ